MSEVTKKPYSEIVQRGLARVPDGLLLISRREGDRGLNNLVAEYTKMAQMDSTMMDIGENELASDLKQAISALEFEKQVELVYIYLAGSGRLSEYIDTEHEVKRFKVNMLWWGGFAMLFLFVFVVGGVVTAGVMRNNIDTNAMLNSFMEIVNHLVDFFGTGKPVID